MQIVFKGKFKKLSKQFWVLNRNINMNNSEFILTKKAFISSQGTLKYIDKGKGSVLLLLHGIPTSSWLYRRMIDGLSHKHRVIAPDMLGFGSSDSPKGYDIYEPKEHARRILELMDSLKIDKWSHVFHDAGGLWTWELLKLSPNRIENLIILNSVIYEEGFKPPIRFKKGFLAKFVIKLYSLSLTNRILLKGLFNQSLVKNTLTKDDLMGYKKPLLEGKTEAMYQFFSKTCNDLPNYHELIKSLSMPKLLIWGKYDEFLIIDKIKEQLKLDMDLEDSNMHIIEAKHYIQEEKPEEINELILSFLA